MITRSITISLLVLSRIVFAQEPAKIAAAFLNSLRPEQKAKTTFAYDHSERSNWQFVPAARNGISLHDLDAAQKNAAMNLLKASLSSQGYAKAAGIIGLENILREVEVRGKDDTYRDPLNYFFTIFGDPANDKPWGWRIEGHHLSLNFSSVDGVIDASTPSFMGANPAIVRKGAESGKQVLKLETNLAFALVNSFDASQLKQAKFSDQALPEIVSGNSRTATVLEPKGISYRDMKETQQKTFMQLLQIYVNNYEFGFSEKLMQKIKDAGVENLSFAWAGNLQPGEGHYYRIQGPMLLIEYDNTQTQANHVHTAVRDLTNDFAEDILREHYRREHKE